MRLTVLVDNNTFIDQYYYGEPALCFYIEDRNTKVLFDTGYSDIFMQNARMMDIDLGSITDIVFSHGHNDHTRGINFLNEVSFSNEVRLIAHPNVYLNRFENGENIGIPYPREKLKQKYKLLTSTKSLKINDRITFLGEIPTYFDFEQRKAIGVLSTNTPDYLIDDTALAYNTGDGLFIITGCSHSGISNIIEHAKYVCGENRIVGVIGGFHLFEVSEQLYKTIAYFKENNIESLYPCHCVSFNAKSEIHKYIPIQEVGVGLVINI